LFRLVLHEMLEVLVPRLPAESLSAQSKPAQRCPDLGYLSLSSFTKRAAELVEVRWRKRRGKVCIE
jgi:hypothetical protein